MSKRSLLGVAAACAFAALAASGLAGGRAKADGVRRPLAFQQGRGRRVRVPVAFSRRRNERQDRVLGFERFLQ